MGRLSALALAATIAAGVLAGTGTGARAGARLEVNALEYPWSAVGRVNAGGRSWCSGTLVGERVVLTAAHCLYNQGARRWWLPSEVHFVAGYQRGASPIHSPVRAMTRADGYVFSGHPAATAEGDDWALLELVDPIGRQAGWIGVEPLTPATFVELRRRAAPVVLAGYRMDRAQIITIDRACGLDGFLLPGNPVFLHDCDSLHGDSGGPLLAFENGGVHVIGVHVVSVATTDGRKLGGAVATTVLTDGRAWPRAVAAVAAAGLVPPSEGRAPPAGGPADPVPTVTVEVLRRDHGPSSNDRASLATLGPLLTRPAPPR